MGCGLGPTGSLRLGALSAGWEHHTAECPSATHALTKEEPQSCDPLLTQRLWAGSGEQRLVMGCGSGPTGSLRLGALSAGLEVTASTTLQMEVRCPHSVPCNQPPVGQDPCCLHACQNPEALSGQLFTRTYAAGPDLSDRCCEGLPVWRQGGH